MLDWVLYDHYYHNFVVPMTNITPFLPWEFSRSSLVDGTKQFDQGIVCWLSGWHLQKYNHISCICKPPNRKNTCSIAVVVTLHLCQCWIEFPMTIITPISWCQWPLLPHCNHTLTSSAFVSPKNERIPVYLITRRLLAGDCDDNKSNGLFHFIQKYSNSWIIFYHVQQEEVTTPLHNLLLI